VVPARDRGTARAVQGPRYSALHARGPHDPAVVADVLAPDPEGPAGPREQSGRHTPTLAGPGEIPGLDAKVPVSGRNINGVMSIWAVRRGARSLGFALAAGAVAVVLALPVASIVKTLRHVQPVRATKPPVSSVVWGDRVFLTPKPLAGWLRVRGVSYSAWAKRHPPANRVLKREDRRRTAPSAR